MKIYLIELTFLIPEDKGKCKILFSTLKAHQLSLITVKYFIVIYNMIVKISSNIKHKTNSDAK